MLKMIRIKIIFLAGLTQLFITNAWAAQPVCNGLADCQALREQADVRIRELEVGPFPNFLDIAKDSDGKVIKMNPLDAKDYCAKKGTRLPTAREFAKLSMSLGSEGLIDDDTCHYTPCHQVHQFPWNDLKEDIFIYSSVGYRRPSGDLGNHSFWSLSHGMGTGPGWYYFNGYDGDIEQGNNWGKRAVLCLAGR